MLDEEELVKLVSQHHKEMERREKINLIVAAVGAVVIFTSATVYMFLTFGFAVPSVPSEITNGLIVLVLYQLGYSLIGYLLGRRERQELRDILSEIRDSNKAMMSLVDELRRDREERKKG